MIKRGLRLRFVPLWAADLPYMREAARRIGKDLELIEPSRYRQWLDAIAGAALRRPEAQFRDAGLRVLVPSVALAYQPACVELRAALGLDDFTLRTDSLLVEDLLDRVDALKQIEATGIASPNGSGALRIRLQGELDTIRSGSRTVLAQPARCRTGGDMTDEENCYPQPAS